MSPFVTLDLDAISAATDTLARGLLSRGIELIGVTKAVDGEPLVGQAMLEAGAVGLADSRLPALVRLAAQALAPLTLLRAPEPHEVAAAAQVADRVMLCDPAAARALGEHAPGYPIELLLTIDLGDRREGVVPDAAGEAASRLARLPGTTLAGISVNFACLSGQLPSRGALPPGRGRARRSRRRSRHATRRCSRWAAPAACSASTGSPRAFAPRSAPAAAPLYGYDFVSAAPLAGLERVRSGAQRDRPGVFLQAGGACRRRRPRRLRPRTRRAPSRRARLARPDRPRAARRRAAAACGR